MLRHRCLVFDHDDTVVDSTKNIHFPAFQDTLKQLRPDTTMEINEFILHCFHPGFSKLLSKHLSFNEEELQIQESNWLAYVENHIPTIFSGMKELMERHKEQGGNICVVSHSFSKNIYRDYEKNGLPKPDLVFGWDRPAKERKPNPYPLQEIMHQLELKPEEILMVDDLKPGYDMAKACNVPFAAAGWAYNIPKINDYMSKQCDFYFTKVKDLYNYLF